MIVFIVSKNKRILKFKIMKNLLLIIVLLFLVNRLQATTYYVDASNGNDANNGMTPTTAWQSIPKVVIMSTGFQPGDTILFKKGEIWIGERINMDTHPSGTFDNPITYGAYGEGAKPIITIHSIQNEIWTDEGSNIWSTISQTGSRYFKNGVEMLRAVNIMYLGLYGTGFYDECYDDCNKLKLFVHSTVDPSQDTYAWSPKSSVFALRYANYINLVDIDF
jgi:hypothetical protein